MRVTNTSVSGLGFWDFTVEAVWNRGVMVSGYDPAVWRQDKCGAWIRRDHYGNTDSQHGWEIDHIRPVSDGGGDELANLQPLHWRNNRGKGDNYPTWSCVVRAS